MKLVNVADPKVEINVRDYMVPDYLGTNEWKLPDKKVNKQSNKQIDSQKSKKEDK